MNTLSKVQREAVEYISGPSLVIAGAGSGKTRVLTHKVAYLMQQGYKPWNILALTFTNKAANEMKERIAKIVGGDSAQYLVMGTFHSIFARILRIEAEHIGYDRNYTIYDEADTKSIVKAATKEVLGAGKSKEELDKLLKNYKPQAIAGTIGLAKNRMITPDIYEKTRGLIERDYEHGMPELHKIYRVYERMLKENNAMDFDDLLLKTYDLLKGNEDIRLKYADQYKFVLVDEYQDTNSVQQRIIELLVKEHHKLCVVGDDAQSIYAFRGAEIDNILDLGKIFPELKLFKLEENYRSTKSIVAVANNLIAHNQRQLHKNVFSNREEGEKPCIMKAVSDRDEAALVANKILNLNRYEHIGFNDIAILYRTNAQSRRFEEQFMKHGCDIPFRIYGGLGFFARAEIKNVISYFRLVVNHNDNEALKRIINYPKRGIGATTIERLEETAAQHGTSIWKTINANDFYGANINSGTKAKIKGFAELISSFSRMLKQMDAFILGEKIISEAGIKQDLKSDQTPEGSARLENLQELLNSLKEFVDMRAEEGEQDAINLDDFLIQAALQTDQESVDARDDDTPKVTLMTMHAAKGLEFECVFIVGLEEEIFPSPRSLNSVRALEEERRLLYVAITRAKQKCYLTRAENRYLYGYEQANQPSRFLRELTPNLINSNLSPRPQQPQRTTVFGATAPKNHFSSRQPASPPAWKTSPKLPSPNQKPISMVSRQTGYPSPNSTNLKVGTRVEHSRYGYGYIIKIEGQGENTMAIVDFDNHDSKKLLLKFAKLKTMEE